MAFEAEDQSVRVPGELLDALEGALVFRDFRHWKVFGLDDVEEGEVCLAELSGLPPVKHVTIEELFYRLDVLVILVQVDSNIRLRQLVLLLLQSYVELSHFLLFRGQLRATSSRRCLCHFFFDFQDLLFPLAEHFEVFLDCLLNLVDHFDELDQALLEPSALVSHFLKMDLNLDGRSTLLEV